MRAGTWDGLPLLAPQGAVLTLGRPSTVTDTLVLGSCRVHLVRDDSKVLAELREAPTSSFEELRFKVFTAVQGALDCLALETIAVLSLDPLPDDEVIWSHWEGEWHLRLTVRRVSSLSGYMTTASRSADGKLVPGANYLGPHHASLRYFRLSQLSDDVFDSFRNVYLALELLLSEVIPKAGLKVGEWVQSASQAAAERYPIADTLDCTSPEDFANTFHDDIYKDVRCRLFHADADRPGLDPGSLSDRRVVIHAYQKVVPVFVALCEHMLNVHSKHSPGRSTISLVEGHCERLRAGEFFLTSRESIAGAAGAAHAMPDAMRCPVESVVESGGADWLAATRFAASADTPPIRRVAVVENDEVVFTAPLSGMLWLSPEVDTQIVVEHFGRTAQAIDRFVD